MSNNFIVGNKDHLGDKIINIFYEADEYIIYETKKRSVRYKAIEEYHKKLTLYSETIGEINSLLSTKPDLKNKYNRLLANTIASIFSNNHIYTDDNLFTRLRDKIRDNIIAIGKLEYLRLCINYIFGALIVSLLFWWYQSSLAGKGFLKEFDSFFYGMVFLASAGCIGGFISVALKINNLGIDIQLPTKRTKLDATVRMVTAMISGILIYWFLKSGFITFVDSSKLNLTTSSGIFLSLSIAVVAGFSERLIPNILTAKEGEIAKSSVVKKKVKAIDTNVNAIKDKLDLIMNNTSPDSIYNSKAISNRIDFIKTQFSNPNINSKYSIIQVFGGDDPTLIGQTKKKVLEYVSGLSGDVTLIALCDYFREGANIIVYHPKMGKDISIKDLVVKELGEINIIDPNILESFITDSLLFCKNSELIALGFYGHGSGVLNEGGIENHIENLKNSFEEGNFVSIESVFGTENLIIGEDFNLGTDSSDHIIGLTNKSAREIIGAAILKSGFSKKIDLLFFDSCLNGSAEVVTQFKDFSKYTVASEAPEFIAGWDYNSWSKLMSTNPPKSAKEWAIQAVKSYEASAIRRKKYNNVTASVIDTSKLNNLTMGINQLINEFKNLTTKEYKILNQIFLDKTESYDDEVYDLKHMIQLLAKSNLSSDLNEICYDIIATLNEVIIYNVAKGNSVKNANGLSIYYPKNLVSALLIQETYQSLLFNKSTNWLDFTIHIKEKINNSKTKLS